MAELIGNIRLIQKRNSDKSITLYYRWSTAGENGTPIPHMERFGRSGPKPTKAVLNRWKDEARAAMRDMRLAITEGYDGRRGGLLNMTIAAGVDAYLTWLYGDDLHAAPVAASTARGTERVLTNFLAHLAECWPQHRRVNQITSQQTAAWTRSRQAQGMKLSTIRTECSLLKGWLDWAWEHGWRAEQIRMARIKAPARINDVPSIAAVQRAIASRPDAMGRAAIHTLAATGMRQGELKALPTAAWSPQDAILTIPQGLHERTKLHGRRLPVGPNLAAVLTEIQREGRSWDDGLLFTWQHRRMSSQLNRWLKRVDLTPHGLRRWFISNLKRLDCPGDVLHDLAGHARGATDVAYDPGGSTPEQMRPWLVHIETLLALPSDQEPSAT